MNTITPERATYDRVNAIYNAFWPTLDRAREDYRASKITESEFLVVAKENKRLLAEIDKAESKL